MRPSRIRFGLRYSGGISIVFIVEVAFKQRLDGIPPEEQLILLDCISILPVVFVDMLEIEIVFSEARNERGFDFLSEQVCPTEIFEPNMALYFCVSIQT